MDPRDTQEHESIFTLPHAAPHPGGDTTRRNPPGFVLPLPGPPAGGAGEQRLGSYRLLRELGRGGMGVVYLAEHVGLRRRVALKVLHAAGDAELVERFQVEARAAARLSHPNVVGVHEVGQEGARWFLAMALVEGESLRARVQRDGPLPCREAARIVEAIARALQHAHERGVLHRDVKPHNILLATDGGALLADFGLAREVDAAGVTVTGQVMGTPAYMPPEQASGEHARVDRRADVYALGATLYEALTGHPPFQGPTAINVLRQVIEDPPQPPSRLRAGVDRDLETICLRCLEKEPAGRYDTAGELAADLSRYQANLPIRARRAGRAERLLKWAQRRPGHALALAATLLLTQATLGLAGGLALQRHQDRQAARAAAETAWATIASAASSSAALDLAGLRRRIEEALEAKRLAERWFELDASLPARDALRRACEHAAGVALLGVAFHDAEAAFAAALRAAPGDPVLTRRLTWVRRLLDSTRLRSTNQLTAARRVLDRAIADAPEWPEGWLERAGLLDVLGDAPGALVDVERALERAPEHPSALIVWADLRERLRRGDPIADWTRLIAAQPSVYSHHHRRAAARWEAGDLTGAIADLDAALALEPGFAALLADRGQVRLQAGDRGGLEDLERAAALAPDTAKLLRVLGEAYGFVGRADEAIQTLTRAIALDPSDPAQYRLLADAQTKVKDLRGALDTLSRGLEACPGDTDLLRMRVGGLLTFGEFATAIADCDRVLAVVPDARTLCLRGEARRLSGELTRAVEDASASLALAPDLPDALLVRGLARDRQGDRDGAARDLERFLQVAPSHPVAGKVRETLARLRAR